MRIIHESRRDDSSAFLRRRCYRRGVYVAGARKLEFNWGEQEAESSTRRLRSNKIPPRSPVADLAPVPPFPQRREAQ